jgi:hypothetical protein
MNGLEMPTTRQQLGFLYEGYQRHVWYAIQNFKVN